jgi:integrase
MATKKWMKSKHKGLRYREHETRKHGLKYDRFYQFRHMTGGKRVEDSFGWLSEGWTEEKCLIHMAQIKQAKTTGEGPRTLAEKRALENKKRDAEAAKIERAKKENMTFESLWLKYHELARSTKKPNTARTELSAIEKWALPAIGKKRLADVCTLDLERIKKRILDAGRTPRMAEYCLAMLRQVFNYGIDHGFMASENPARRVKRLKFDNKRLRYLTKDEAETLLMELKARSQDLHDMALLSLHTATRGGEIFGLDWQDIDIETGKVILRDTKNTETRVVYMSETVKAMFEQRRNTAGPGATGLIFPGRKGKRITSISRTFDRVVDELGLNTGITDKRYRFTFHCLRHTAASWLVQAGTPLFTVQQLLGHKTSGLTARYSHLAPANLQETAKFFDQMGTRTGETIPLTGQKNS